MNRHEQIRRAVERFLYRAAPASEQEIQQLLLLSPIELPNEYLDLLRLTNGGEVELALPPMLFCPYEVKYLLELLKERPFDEVHDSFFIIGSNGGLETIAFEVRHSAPHPVVMLDLIGGEETAIKLAGDFTDFIATFGFTYSEL